MVLTLVALAPGGPAIGLWLKESMRPSLPGKHATLINEAQVATHVDSKSTSDTTANLSPLIKSSSIL